MFDKCTVGGMCMKQKRIVASMLTAAMLFSAVPMQAVWADEVEPSDDVIVSEEEIPEEIPAEEESGETEESSEEVVEEVIVEEEDIVVDEITTEDSEFRDETEAEVEVEETEEAFMQYFTCPEEMEATADAVEFCNHNPVIVKMFDKQLLNALYGE